tara:strand:+ start:670 stop:1116 length:447 start_codon:yes stop_codon:yes gene_type:complete
MSEIVTISFENSELTILQKEVVKSIYSVSKEAVTEIVTSPEINDAVVVISVIGKLIRFVEDVKVNGATLSGENKKQIVLYLGRVLLDDVLPAEQKGTVLVIYDSTAETALEKMMEVANNINNVAVDLLNNTDDAPRNCLAVLARIFRG